MKEIKDKFDNCIYLDDAEKLYATYMLFSTAVKGINRKLIKEYYKDACNRIIESTR